MLSCLRRHRRQIHSQAAPSGPARTQDLDALLRDHLKAGHTASAKTEAISHLAACVFERVVTEARELTNSPLTSLMAHMLVLRHTTLVAALACSLSTKLVTAAFPNASPAKLKAPMREYQSLFARTLSKPAVLSAVLADIAKAWKADPAIQGLLQPLFFFKGFQALTTHRIAHDMWKAGGATNVAAALLMQSCVSELYAVDIHPGATFGAGVMLDHATGIVIGSTAVVGSDVYMLHEATLGATGKPMGDARRHPKVGSSCTIGAGSKVLGDVVIGDKTTIGATAVVTRNIPRGGTVVGVNSLIKRRPSCLVDGSFRKQDERAAEPAAAPSQNLMTGGAEPYEPAGTGADSDGGPAAATVHYDSADVADDDPEAHTWLYQSKSVLVVAEGITSGLPS